MHSWLLELKENVGPDLMIHIVGTKLDLVNADPSRREVPFETCVAYASQHLSTDSSDGFDGAQCCHEISAKDDEGVEEVFEVITRKLIERKRTQLELESSEDDYYDRPRTVYVHKDEPEPSSSCC
jgi:GTPase SAR1 family protein